MLARWAQRAPAPSSRAFARWCAGCAKTFNFGLGAISEAGVTAALQIVRNELDTTMALCDVRMIGEIGRNVVLNPY